MFKLGNAVLVLALGFKLLLELAVQFLQLICQRRGSLLNAAALTALFFQVGGGMGARGHGFAHAAIGIGSVAFLRDVRCFLLRRFICLRLCGFGLWRGGFRLVFAGLGFRRSLSRCGEFAVQFLAHLP